MGSIYNNNSPQKILKRIRSHERKDSDRTMGACIMLIICCLLVIMDGWILLQKSDYKAGWRQLQYFCLSSSSFLAFPLLSILHSFYTFIKRRSESLQSQISSQIEASEHIREDGPAFQYTLALAIMQRKEGVAPHGLNQQVILEVRSVLCQMDKHEIEVLDAFSIHKGYKQQRTREENLSWFIEHRNDAETAFFWHGVRFSLDTRNSLRDQVEESWSKLRVRLV